MFAIALTRYSDAGTGWPFKTLNWSQLSDLIVQQRLQARKKRVETPH